jgi:hypothetical protein
MNSTFSLYSDEERQSQIKKVCVGVCLGSAVLAELKRTVGKWHLRTSGDQRLEGGSRLDDRHEEYRHGIQGPSDEES